MHDGKTPYPGAVDCIDRLRQAGKKVVSVSSNGCAHPAFVCLPRTVYVLELRVPYDKPRA